MYCQVLFNKMSKIYANKICQSLPGRKTGFPVPAMKIVIIIQHLIPLGLIDFKSRPGMHSSDHQGRAGA